MAQKRKINHKKSASKKAGAKASGRKKPADNLDSMLDLLDGIEKETARILKGNLADDWRENLFEIVMTRVDLAAPHKKRLARLPEFVRADPAAVPQLARRYWGTMKRILQLADAPARKRHVAAFGVLYASIIDTFLKDDTRDHAKTMAALDKRLGLFGQFVDFCSCER